LDGLGDGFRIILKRSSVAAVALFHLVRIFMGWTVDIGTGRYRCGSAGLALSLPVASLFSGSDSQRTRHATMSGRANNRSQCASRWKRAVSSRCSGSLFLNTRGMAQIATALIGPNR
jgi:hypothetical protein